MKYKGFCRKYPPKEKTPTRCHWGSKLLAGVHLPSESERSRSTSTNGNTKRYASAYQEYQVSENPELTLVVRQFIEANRAPRDVEKGV